jgi:hypothetical protein
MIPDSAFSLDRPCPQARTARWREAGRNVVFAPSCVRVSRLLARTKTRSVEMPFEYRDHPGPIAGPSGDADAPFAGPSRDRKRGASIHQCTCGAGRSTSNRPSEPDGNISERKMAGLDPSCGGAGLRAHTSRGEMKAAQWCNAVNGCPLMIASVLFSARSDLPFPQHPTITDLSFGTLY